MLGIDLHLSSASFSRTADDKNLLSAVHQSVKSMLNSSHINEFHKFASYIDYVCTKLCQQEDYKEETFDHTWYMLTKVNGITREYVSHILKQSSISEFNLSVQDALARNIYLLPGLFQKFGKLYITFDTKLSIQNFLHNPLTTSKMISDFKRMLKEARRDDIIEDYPGLNTLSTPSPTLSSSLSRSLSSHSLSSHSLSSPICDSTLFSSLLSSSVLITEITSHSDSSLSGSSFSSLEEA